MAAAASASVTGVSNKAVHSDLVRLALHQRVHAALRCSAGYSFRYERFCQARFKADTIHA